jgi:hypothetical protein
MNDKIAQDHNNSSKCIIIHFNNKIDPYVSKAIERAKNKLKNRCYSLFTGQNR